MSWEVRRTVATMLQDICGSKPGTSGLRMESWEGSVKAEQMSS